MITQQGAHGHIGQHLSSRLRHVPRWQPIEGVDQNIVPAHVTPAEVRESGLEPLVFSSNDLFEHVLHPTMANSFPAPAGTPVKVAPVVPVSRTVR